MKTKKKNLQSQRKIVERKLHSWFANQHEKSPPSGWLKAVRGALGITTEQLANRIGVTQSAITQFENAEAHGKASLETVEKAARAMHCKLVYAIVPEDEFDSLDSILNAQALEAAKNLISKVDHSMRLEKQGITQEEASERVKELAAELKAKMDPSLWSVPKRKRA